MQAISSNKNQMKSIPAESQPFDPHAGTPRLSLHKPNHISKSFRASADDLSVQISRTLLFDSIVQRVFGTKEHAMLSTGPRPSILRRIRTWQSSSIETIPPCIKRKRRCCRKSKGHQTLWYLVYICFNSRWALPLKLCLKFTRVPIECDQSV